MVGVSAVLADGRAVHTRVAPRRAAAPTWRARCAAAGTIGFLVRGAADPRPAQARLVAAYELPSVDAAVGAVYLALREEVAPSGLRIYDAAEAALHFGGLALPSGHALLCAATAGPTDLATCDRDLIASAVIAEGGSATDQGLAELWWRRIHAGEPTPGPQPTLQVMASPSKLRAVYRAVTSHIAEVGSGPAPTSRFNADGLSCSSPWRALRRRQSRARARRPSHGDPGRARGRDRRRLVAGARAPRSTATLRAARRA